MTKNTRRIAIVTGATSGIGEATARKFVSEGFAVVGNGRTADKLRQLEAELGESFIGVAGDITEPLTIDELFKTAHQKFGSAPDIVIANAGRGLGGSVKDVTIGEFEQVLKINLTSTLALLQKSARSMLENQSASFPLKTADIVIVGSVVGRNISPFSAAYGSTKFAVHALAEGLRRELGPKGIRVSLIEPGLVLSGFQEGAGYSDDMVENFKDKFGPLLVGDEVADSICFIVNQPPHVHISELMVRPTRQDYP